MLSGVRRTIQSCCSCNNLGCLLGGSHTALKLVRAVKAERNIGKIKFDSDVVAGFCTVTIPIPADYISHIFTRA